MGERPRNLLQRAWDVLREPMLLLLLGAGTVNFLLAEPLDGVILMSFVVVVIGISIYQARKAENAPAALRDLSSPARPGPARRPASAHRRAGRGARRRRPARPIQHTDWLVALVGGFIGVVWSEVYKAVTHR